VEIVDKLPQGNTDKLDKRALEQQLLRSGHLPWTVEA
jgi:hypothetical protein